MTTTLVALVSLAVGAGFGFLIARSRAARALAERDLARQERTRSDEALAAARNRVEVQQQLRVAAETRLGETQRQLEEMAKFVSDARQQLEGTYAKLSKDALGGAIEQLLQVLKPHLDGNKGEIVSSLDTKKVEIEALLTPLREMLDHYRAELVANEQKRSRDYGSLDNQLRQLLEATEATRREASRVATALTNPKVRGTWGEQALRRCVELAGMSEYCDFTLQETFEGEERRVRPDLIVKLPAHRVIAVDAKAPMTAYIESANEPDEGRQRELLALHAKNLRRHIDQLSSREYHENVGDSLDFTVLFLGGEQFLYAALVADGGLFDYAAEKKVYLATPTVLIPLLRAVAAGWRAERTEENAQRSLDLARDLYERFIKVFRDVEAVGGALDTAIRKYNEAIRSIDTRLAPKARELQTHVDSSRDVPEFEPIDKLALVASKLM
ncbi:MAG TPA: DNA recombination protein RmuC [Thermoanaerobaculia bacterium]